MSGNRGFLTKDQTDLIEGERGRFNNIPLDQPDAYFKAVQEFLQKIYKAFNLEMPKIYRFASPLAAMMALPHVIRQHTQGDHVYTLNDMRNALGSTLRSTAGPEIGGIMNQAISLRADEQISEIYQEAFLEQMKSQFSGKTKDFTSLIENFNPDFNSGKLWWQSVAGGAWIWPYNKFAIVSDRPIQCGQDDRNRPHGEDDAAIEFADHYRVWVWQGVLVPKRIILFPKTLKFEDVEKERNLEIRRIIIERMGHKEYLKQAGAVLEDMDTLTLDGSAPRALMRDKLGNKWLVGTDGSTARVYTMAVPIDVKTCKEAHEAISGFDESRLIAEA